MSEDWFEDVNDRHLRMYASKCCQGRYNNNQNANKIPSGAKSRMMDNEDCKLKEANLEDPMRFIHIGTSPDVATHETISARRRMVFFTQNQ